MNLGRNGPADQGQQIDLRVAREHQARIQETVDPRRFIGSRPYSGNVLSPSRATARMMLLDSKMPILPSGLNAAGTVPNGCASINASVLCSVPLKPTLPAAAYRPKSRSLARKWMRIKVP